MHRKKKKCNNVLRDMMYFWYECTWIHTPLAPTVPRSDDSMRVATWFLMYGTEWGNNCNHHVNTALIWQKEASVKSDISRKRAKCVCHLHWRQWNIMMSYLTYLLVGWVFLHEIWPGRRAYYVNYENINNSNLDGMSLASFCQSRAE